MKGGAVGPRSLAGGKGARTKGKGNLPGQDGKPLQCHRCGSTDHFIDRCPKGKGKGASQGRSYFEDVSYDLEPGQEHLAGVGCQYTAWQEESASFIATDYMLTDVTEEEAAVVDCTPQGGAVDYCHWVRRYSARGRSRKPKS